MEFYNLKTRSRVEIAESDITKIKMVRATKTGEQTRYAVKATHEGTPLTKFISHETYEGLTNVKEGTETPKAAKPAAEKKPAAKPAAAKKAAAPAKKAAPKKK